MGERDTYSGEATFLDLQKNKEGYLLITGGGVYF